MKKAIRLMMITVLMVMLCALALVGCDNTPPVDSNKIGNGTNEQTVIETVNISVPQVIGGGYITRPGLFDAITREDGYTVATKWYKVSKLEPEFEYEEAKDGDTFEVGKLYIASFSFTATTGELAEHLTVKVTYNGETKDAHYDEVFGYSFSFYCDEVEMSDIYQVSIFLPTVFGGNDINRDGNHDAMTREFGYTVKTTWYTVTNPSAQDFQYRKSEEGEKFEVGNYYIAAFAFTADDGKPISPDLLVWVNNNNQQKQGNKDEVLGDFFMVYCGENAVQVSIYQVNISIPKVLGGNYINRAGNHDATTTETGYTVKTTWYTVTNSSISDFQYRKSEEGEQFEEGKFYIADLEFTADGEIGISPNLLVWVNYGDQQIQGSKDELFGNFFMAYCGESIPPEPEINMAKISMRKLYADYGKANTYKATTKDDTYTVSTKWYKVTKLAPTYEYVEVTATEYFELGQMYIAQFTFTPNEGILAKDFTAWITYDGSENKVIFDETLGYCYAFTCKDEYIVN